MNDTTLAPARSVSRGRTRQVNWAAIAQALLSLSPDEAINFTLREIGTARATDRAWMIRYNREFTHFWNTHEWARAGVDTFVHELQGSPILFGHWINSRIARGETVSVDDVRSIFGEARELRKVFHRQRIQSILCIPVFHEGRPAIQIGFDAVRRPISWTDLDAEIVRTAGDLIALKLFHTAAPSPDPFPLTDPTASRIRLRDGSTIYSVPENEVVWIESQDDFSRVHLRTRSAVMELKTLAAWEKQLPPERFLRIHRRAIVNLAHIETLKRRDGTWRLFLTGARDPIPVGRNYRSALRTHLAV